MIKKIFNRKFTVIIFMAAITFTATFLSCKEKQQVVDELPPVPIEETSHNWYYFTNDSYKKIDKPQNAPIKQNKPWTEAVRISSAATANSIESYAIVNRLGVLTFDNDKITLSQDKNIFDNRTAGNIIFSNGTPLFSVYKSAFFNDTITEPDYVNDESAHLFLVQFDPLAKISYPLLNCSAFTDEPNSEITDFVWHDDKWLCAIKTISEKRNNFSYISWKTQSPLLSLTPNKGKDNIIITNSDSQSFRNAKSQIDYNNAPTRIKELLTGFSKDLPFNIEIKTAGGGTPRQYINKIENSSSKELLGKGTIAPSWSAVLFEDGTLFIEGALPGKHILRNGKPVAIRLPKLPAGFLYSDFTISGTTLYAAWEESSFYKTGRSGFIQIDLDKTLYSKLI